MARRAELRQKAALCRRAASVPTIGGHCEDRVLLAVAEQLEQEAEALERRLSHQPRHTIED